MKQIKRVFLVTQPKVKNLSKMAEALKNMQNLTCDTLEVETTFYVGKIEVVVFKLTWENQPVYRPLDIGSNPIK